jgi:hypothetical protein
MDILWRNNKLKKEAMKKALSNPTCKKRLAQLDKAPCYTDLPRTAGAHFLEGDLENFFAIDFDYPTRLICEPCGDYIKNGNQFVKESIKSLEIIDIKKDYHQK